MLLRVKKLLREKVKGEKKKSPEEKSEEHLYLEEKRRKTKDEFREKQKKARFLKNKSLNPQIHIK